MLTNLGNNNEALKILLSKTVTISSTTFATVFNLGKFIQSVQSQFGGRGVTKVHLRAIKPTQVGTPNSEVIGYYALDGLATGFDVEFPPEIINNGSGFLLTNNQEIELYGNVNFNDFVCTPAGNGSQSANPLISPIVANFRLEITLFGL